MITLIANFASLIGFNPKEAERFAKFLVVGTVGFILDFGTLTFLVEVVDLPTLVAENTQFTETVGLILANTISFSLAVLSNFTFNRYWTYPESRGKRKRVQLPQFTVVSIIGLILNNTILALTTPIFNWLIATITFLQGNVQGYMPAKILATVVVLFWNFFINRYWTYSNVE
ncbi:MAG: GtrA family protein [Chloroflexota bacterium]|jgi:putative flippase GtrA